VCRPLKRPTVPHIDLRPRKTVNRKRSVTRPTALSITTETFHPPTPSRTNSACSVAVLQTATSTDSAHTQSLVSTPVSLTPIPTQRHTHHGTFFLLLPLFSLPHALAITRRSSRSVVAYLSPLRYVCLAALVRTDRTSAATRRRIYPVLNTRHEHRRVASELMKSSARVPAPETSQLCLTLTCDRGSRPIESGA
jgi:hypothetical protein